MERQSTSGFRIITVSCPSMRQGRILAGVLLREKLAVCVNIIKHLESHYFWKGKIERSQECLLLIKAEASSVSKAMDKIEKLHSYECPVIDVVNIEKMNESARKWMEKELR